MKLYRVFPHHPGARSDEPGGPLHVPQQGRSRIDNPDIYRVLYASDDPAGAVAEVFNVGDYRQRWSPAMLRPRGGGAPAIATLELSKRIHVIDLDDAAKLVELRLRPSDVVTRDYTATRAWAKRVYALRRFAGVRWWSYHDARWGSIGIWRNREHLRCLAVEPLGIDHPAVRAAAEALSIEVLA